MSVLSRQTMERGWVSVLLLLNRFQEGEGVGDERGEHLQASMSLRLRAEPDHNIIWRYFMKHTRIAFNTSRLSVYMQGSSALRVSLGRRVPL